MVVPGAGAYAASKSAVNMISAVARKELAGTGVTVGVVLPSTTATEFAGGRFQPGQQTVPGLTAHNPVTPSPSSCARCAPARSASTFPTEPSSPNSPRSRPASLLPSPFRGPGPVRSAFKEFTW